MGEQLLHFQTGVLGRHQAVGKVEGLGPLHHQQGLHLVGLQQRQVVVVGAVEVLVGSEALQVNPAGLVGRPADVAPCNAVV